MNKHISDVDAEAKARRWLGGEASVPRYPQRRRPIYVQWLSGEPRGASPLG